MSRIEVTPGMFSQAEQKKSLKAPIVMAIVTLFTFVFFAILGPTTEVTFQITETDAFVTLPDLALPSNALGYGTAAVMVLITIASLWFGVTKKRVPQMFAVVYGLVAIVALLGWLAAGADVPVGFLLGNTLVLALPIILGGMGGIMSERVGVVNIAIEGQLLTGAFLAAVIGSITGSLWVGVLAAMIGAALLSTVLASLSIKYLVDQIIIGVLLNVLVIGVTETTTQRRAARDRVLQVSTHRGTDLLENQFVKDKVLQLELQARPTGVERLRPSNSNVCRLAENVTLATCLGFLFCAVVDLFEYTRNSQKKLGFECCQGFGDIARVGFVGNFDAGFDAEHFNKTREHVSQRQKQHGASAFNKNIWKI